MVSVIVFPLYPAAVNHETAAGAKMIFFSAFSSGTRVPGTK